MQEETKQNNPIIFVDGSYYCFHRYYSILKWMKFTFKDIDIGVHYENEVFVEKFKRTFINNLKALPKKLGLDPKNTTIVVGKDCKRSNIWRMELLPSYKGTRDEKRNGTEFMGGPLFQMAYDTLFESAGIKQVLYHEKLEGDDCIAITVKYITEQNNKKPVYIITSDKDYLQLCGDNVKIYDLAFKNLAEQKSGLGTPKMELFCKIVMGDISDNIPSILKKCGPKTALKCFHDKNYFEERLEKENAHEKWKLNNQLIDFHCIPQDLQKEFIEKYIM